MTDRRAGLNSAEAAARLQRFGYNEWPSPDRRSFLRILVEVLRQPMFALLLGGGLVYLLLGDRLEALLLLAFAGLSVSITLVQESRSEKVLEALRSLASPRARVLRDGQIQHLPGREIVPGELLLLAEGDRIAADATLLEAEDLLADESLLTGESVPVSKIATADAPEQPAVPPQAGGEGLPYLFSGTLIVRGSGLARVHATGLKTETGLIGRALKGIEIEQPKLQGQIRWLLRDFAIAGLVAGVLMVLLYGWLRGSWLEALLGGIALGMSLLPEEFPLVLAVFMAMGAWRISKLRVLTRRAAAIETLGATTVLCTDKTGTLTHNRMTVSSLIGATAQWQAKAAAAPSENVLTILRAALAASPQRPTDPMDLAIHHLVQQQDAAALPQFLRQRILRSFGLRPELFAVANILAGEGGDEAAATAYAKGAIEAILQLCKLSAAQAASIHAQADARAEAGIRVLGVARATVPGAGAATASLSELPFEYLGLIGFADPLRDTVPAAVAECRAAGIRVLMITGDYPATAAAIAREAGLDASRVLSGDELDALSDVDLKEALRSCSVFARIRPAQKLRLVEGLKAAGEVVAMTGDGVNDAPAIKAAHIGIAMGGRGTDVAREAASLVLLDDDFGSIVTTIRLGRRIYDNLRKAIEYIVAVHIPIAGLALLPLLLDLPLILTPILIAFLEMVIDPACSIVFEAEDAEDDVMQRPPRKPDSPLLLRERILWALMQGGLLLTLLAALLITAAQRGLPESELRSLVFTALVLGNLSLILVNRSFSASLSRALLGANRALWILLAGVGLLLAVVLYWPPASSLLHLGPLHGDDLAVCAAIGVGSLMLLEQLKRWWFGRRH